MADRQGHRRLSLLGTAAGAFCFDRVKFTALERLVKSIAYCAASALLAGRDANLWLAYGYGNGNIARE
jgi:hypothetical protein